MIGMQLLLAASTFLAPPLSAQLADRMFQTVIVRSGGSCPGVERAQAIGTGSGGDALVAVDCARGGRHVVRIHTDDSVSYMTSCQELESSTGIRCFGERGGTREGRSR